MRKGWDYKKLGEVCAPKTDILRANKLFHKDDVIEYIDISSIDNSAHSITQPTRFLFYEAPSRAQQKVEQGDILYSLVRPNLKNIAVVTSSDTDKYVASSGFCVLRSKEVDHRYLYHLVLSNPFNDYIMGLVSGANYPAVREDDIKGFSFRCPPIADQQRIVAELDKINELISLKKAQLSDLDTLAQSIFYEMFGDPIENEKGWEVKKLGEIGEVERGAGISKKDFVDEGLPCIHYGQLHTILGPVTKKHYTSIPNSLLPKYKTAQTGDLIMAITSEDVEGSCKSTAWLGDYNVVVGSDAAILHHKQDGTFLSYYTMTKAFYNEKAKYAKGFKVTHISAKEIESIPIYLPPLPLQQSFARKIEAIEQQKTQITATIKDLETLLASRMQYWFD